MYQAKAPTDKKTYYQNLPLPRKEGGLEVTWTTSKFWGQGSLKITWDKLIKIWFPEETGSNLVITNLPDKTNELGLTETDPNFESFETIIAPPAIAPPKQGIDAFLDALPKEPSEMHRRKEELAADHGVTIEKATELIASRIIGYIMTLLSKLGPMSAMVLAHRLDVRSGYLDTILGSDQRFTMDKSGQWAMKPHGVKQPDDGVLTPEQQAEMTLMFLSPKPR